MISLKVLCIFGCLLCGWVQTSTPEDDSYVAAVLEYNFTSNTTTNLYNYLQFIKQAADQNADIIVFPEMTLNIGQVNALQIPVHGLLKTYPIPAIYPQYYDEILVTLSEAARENQIYVVANVIELMDCVNVTEEFCPEKKIYQFNTNVVFDRNGTVIDRYRKINLFGEFSRTPALSPDLGVFSTDFGVTFGHFICFDLMFQVPSIQIVQKLNLTDVIFPTMWFSEMPYLTAVQIQEAYAYSMNVNFLAAGANAVRVGSAGSGIYSGKAGALISTMPGLPTTRLLVSRVPKVPGKTVEHPGPINDNPKDHDSLKMKVDPSLLSHVTQLVQDGKQDIELTHGNVVCKFTIKINQQIGDHKYRYRAAVLDGVRTFDGVATGGKQVCSVLACLGEDISTCAQRFPEYQNASTSLFEELTITAEFPAPVYNATIEATNSAYFPVSLSTYMLPLEPQFYTVNNSTSNGRITYKMALVQPIDTLYSFGVWGRVFITDGLEPTPPLPTLPPTAAPDSSVLHLLNTILLLGVFINITLI